VAIIMALDQETAAWNRLSATTVTFPGLAAQFRQTRKVKAMNNIIELTEAGFETEVLEARGLVLVDFYAPWCGPCKMLAPFLDQLAGEFAGRVKFAKLNVDEAPDIAGQYDITGVPMLLLFRNGQPLDSVVGMAPPQTLKKWLEKALASNPEPAAVAAS
jgi:thioredoxin 1